MRYITSLLAATLPLLSAGEAHLIPAGKFAARDGRPTDTGNWTLTDAAGAALSARLNATAAATPIVIDYEHQTMLAATNGQPAPAAGWIKSTAWRNGVGLVGAVDWTPRAKAFIDAGEYRFISPVISSDVAGNVTGLHNAALVNFPALLGTNPVVAQLAAQFAFNPQTESSMTLLASLIASLGLPADTAEPKLLEAVSALKATAAAAGTKPALPVALSAALGLQANADEAAAVTAVTALKGASDSTHLVQLVTTLQGEVVALKAGQTEDQVVKLVDETIAAGKFIPAMRDQWLVLGRKDIAALKTMAASTPVIPGLGGQSGGREPSAGNTHALSASQMAVCTQMGIAPEKYAASLKAETTAA